MASQFTFLVLGATGGTGRHFVAKVLAEGHKVRAFVRSPAKLQLHVDTNNLEIHEGSITDDAIDMDQLVKGVEFVVAMLGDRSAQQSGRIVTPFVEKLVPSMRRHNVKRFLYQAGGLSRPFGESLSPLLWILRNTIARGYIGQHEDNEAVMAYLVTEADDLEWMVHRAGIGSDGASKGLLRRSDESFSVATFRDCADYNYRTVLDSSAIHTTSFSRYA